MASPFPETLISDGGIVRFFGKILDNPTSEKYFKHLLKEIPWEQDEVVIFGRRILTKRMTAWYGEEAFEYTYSRVTRKARIWTPELAFLRDLVEAETNLSFNSCLLNLYNSGEEGMSWHADAEAELGKNPAIASLSLGATRKFVLKRKDTQRKVSIDLEKGSLLLMEGETQKNWVHSLPPTKRVKDPRINLTFRNIVNFKK